MFSFLRALEEILKKNPELSDQVCVTEYETKDEITYGQLNSRANKLARVLIEKSKNRSNIDGDILVALRFLPSIELIVTMVALAKCGLSYVPIAPNWPAGRIRLILEDAKPILILTNAKADLIYKGIREMVEENQNSSVPAIYQVTKKAWSRLSLHHVHHCLSFQREALISFHVRDILLKGCGGSKGLK